MVVYSSLKILLPSGLTSFSLLFQWVKLKRGWVGCRFSSRCSSPCWVASSSSSSACWSTATGMRADASASTEEINRENCDRGSRCDPLPSASSLILRTTLYWREMYHLLRTSHLVVTKQYFTLCLPPLPDTHTNSALPSPPLCFLWAAALCLFFNEFLYCKYMNIHTHTLFYTNQTITTAISPVASC